MPRREDFPEVVKVGGLPYPHLIPYAYRTEDETIYTADANFVILLRDALGFKVELLLPVDKQNGNRLDNGSWTGMVGMIHREEADIAIGKLAITEGRTEALDFSYPYYYSPITFITDKPEYLPNTYAIVYPFSPSVWIAVATSLIAMLLLTYAFKSRRDAHSDMLLNIYASLLETSVDVRLHRFSTRLMIFSWVIGAMLLSYSYKAVLLSFLTFPTATGIRNIAEFSKASEKDTFRCSTYPGSFILPSLLGSNDEATKKIGECLNRCDCFVRDIEEFLGDHRYKNAYIGTGTDLNALEKGYFVSDDSFFTVYVGIGVRKTFCCKHILDDTIHKMAAVGLLDKVDREEKFFRALAKSYLQSEDSNPNRKLSLDDVTGAFIFLISGSIIATVVLLVEMVLGRKHLKYKH